MILVTRPELVNKNEYTNVDAIRCNNSLRGPVSTWGLQVTKTCLFGDPSSSSVEVGQKCFEVAVEEGAKILIDFYNYKAE